MPEEINLAQTVLVTSPDHTFSLGKMGRAYFAAHMQLVLEFIEDKQTLRYSPGLYTIIGRGQTNIEDPYLDLTPFAAVEKGVSRRHARLIRSSILNRLNQ